jgi:hypothetical protein
MCFYENMNAIHVLHLAVSLVMFLKQWDYGYALKG